jgi:hypothetical protein
MTTAHGLFMTWPSDRQKQVEAPVEVTVAIDAAADELGKG